MLLASGFLAKINFAGPIAHERLDLEVSSLKELSHILQQMPPLKSWLKISAVSVNGVLASDLNTKLSKEDEVVILPPVCGG